jgi:protein-S-isoprenylcysteine O-methyltransferase Ste14
MSGSLGSNYGMWGIAAAWVLMFGAFVLFVPLHRREDRRPAAAFLIYVLAYAAERYGAPLSRFLFSRVFNVSLPPGVLWGHTLSGSIGMTGHYLFLAALTIGGALIVAGWARIRLDYWSRDESDGRLVREGIYRCIRHPQYSGFLLISFSLLAEWATLPLLLLWPLLAVLYYRTACREEAELEGHFGEEWRQYRQAAGMFLPRLEALRRQRHG